MAHQNRPVTIHKMWDQFIINHGTGVLRVVPVREMPSPFSKNRVIKVFRIEEIIHQAGNVSYPEKRVALSFPEDKKDADEYFWKPNEECHVHWNYVQYGPASNWPTNPDNRHYRDGYPASKYVRYAETT